MKRAKRPSKPRKAPKPRDEYVRMQDGSMALLEEIHERDGVLMIASESGLSPRTITKVLAGHRMSPVTLQRIRCALAWLQRQLPLFKVAV